MAGRTRLAVVLALAAAGGSGCPGHHHGAGAHAEIHCSANPTSGAAPLTVAFGLDVAGALGAVSVAIQYGDGTQGTNPDARHVYARRRLHGIHHRHRGRRDRPLLGADLRGAGACPHADAPDREPAAERGVPHDARDERHGPHRPGALPRRLQHVHDRRSRRRPAALPDGPGRRRRLRVPRLVRSRLPSQRDLRRWIAGTRPCVWRTSTAPPGRCARTIRRSTRSSAAATRSPPSPRALSLPDVDHSPARRGVSDALRLRRSRCRGSVDAATEHGPRRSSQMYAGV